MTIERLFRLTEEQINKGLAAEKVKIKIDAIDADGNLYFVCMIKMDNSIYLKTPRIRLLDKAQICPHYVVKRLEPIVGGWEMLRIKKLLG